jgi:biopolymer transport protein ExbB
MEDQGREEITTLERHLGILATIAGVAPMLGFLGTVTGLVSAFQSVASAAGQPSPADLADGIWEALITTVFGLVVGIPVAAAYNYLLSQVQSITSSCERIARDTLDAIEEIIYHGKQVARDEEPLKLRKEEARS